MEQKERPILFSGPMVRAILEGRKTQTRRVVNPQPEMEMDGEICNDGSGGYDWAPVWPEGHKKAGKFMGWSDCPYGKPGDMFYVKEKHKYYDWTEDGEPFIQYAADGEVRLCRVDSEEWGEKIVEVWAKLSAIKNYLIQNRACDQKWRPSIHMPRWASRITLEIVAVRFERLQDISEDDAIAEGIHVDVNGHAFTSDDDIRWLGPRTAFCDLWQSAYGPGSWEKNPFVWVIEFKRI